MNSARQPICLITDGSQLRISGQLVSRLTQVLEAADGCVGLVQLREQVDANKAASDEEVLKLAEKLLPICHKYNSKLIINRRCDLAKACGADGVHLGKIGDGFDKARELLSHQACIGYSAHSVDEALSAQARGYDYIFLSPIFSPLSKSDQRPPLGIDSLTAARSAGLKNFYALGGVSAENALSCIQAGAAGVAMITSILLVSDPISAASQLAQLLRG